MRPFYALPRGRMFSIASKPVKTPGMEQGQEGKFALPVMGILRKTSQLIQNFLILFWGLRYWGPHLRIK